MTRILCLLSLALAGFAPSLWAAETPYDFVKCATGKITPLEISADLRAAGMENWGITASSTTKDFENATTHCVGFSRVVEGKPAGRGLCKWMDSAGNTAFGEYEVLAPGEGTFVWVTGTGKFKGIKGGGQWKVFSSAKPVAEGTAQWCERYWGKYTLP